MQRSLATLGSAGVLTLASLGVGGGPATASDVPAGVTWTAQGVHVDEPAASALAQEQASAVAGAQSVGLAQDAAEDQEQESDKTGLWGLLGLAGLAGLFKRKTTERSDIRPGNRPGRW